MAIQPLTPEILVKHYGPTALADDRDAVGLGLATRIDDQDEEGKELMTRFLNFMDRASRQEIDLLKRLLEDEWRDSEMEPS